MADINVDDITNSGGTGVFDKLMESINGQIETQYLSNRITGSDYATVYLGSLQAALSQSIQFAMQEELTEAQVDGVIADNALKAKQLEITQQELLAKTFEVASILPLQRDKLTKDIDVTERSMSEQEATGVKQRVLLDTEEEAKQYEVNNLLPSQFEKLQEEIDLLQTQENELSLDGAKKRLLMDEELDTANLQQILLETEEEIKTAQKAEILAATSRNDTELADKLLTTAKQRILLDEEKETADKQQLLADAQLKTAYADRVLKDKQAAKLGLDNTMKIAEDQRKLNPSFVYIPNYQE